MKPLSIAIACAFMLIFGSCTKKSDAPDIILMMADDLGWGDTGFNGNKGVQTPSMDRMADMGVVFSRFYSASPVCSPTRASCLTGRNPYRLGIPNANSGYLPEDEISLAEILKGVGYVCGHFGKWHLGTFTSTMIDANRGKPGNEGIVNVPTDHGFDYFFSTESKVPTWDPMIRPSAFDTASGENLRYGWTAPVSESDSLFYRTRYWTGAEQAAFDNLRGDDSRVIMDRAIDFIERSVGEGQKYFSVLWFHTPHLPVVVPIDYKERFAGEDNRTQIYYGSIAALDEQIGRLWSTLEELGTAENTLIFFCSDNGPELRTPGSAGLFRGKKRDLYEGGIRVPAYVVWRNKFKGGLVTAYPAFTSDYLPTIMDILELEYEGEKVLDGISLLPALNGLSHTREKAMGFLYPGKKSWVGHQYKLISTNNGEGFELYDLINDPGEKNNIIDEKANIAEEMKADFLEWEKAVLFEKSLR